MDRYVSGFLFRPGCRSEVVLVQKLKPDFLKGQWTGVGGKVEQGETLHEAMVREFQEETGVLVEDWEHYCTLKGEGFELDWFLSESDKFYELEDKITELIWNNEKLADQDFINDAGERVDIWEVESPPELSNNAQWLIPMALSIRNDRARAFHIQELY